MVRSIGEGGINMKFKNKRILICASHPDDAEISMGGTISLLKEMNCEITLVIFALTNPAETRLKEAKESAAYLDINLEIVATSETQVIDYTVVELVKLTDHYIGKYNPDIVFTHFYNDSHVDHRHLYRAVLSSSRKNIYSLICMNNLSPFALGMNEFNNSLIIDVSKFIDKKINAIKMHSLQKNVQHNYLNSIVEQNKYLGKINGYNFAEAIHIIRLRISDNEPLLN